LLTNVNAVQLQGRSVASAAPSGDQVITWNAGTSVWEPRTFAGGSDNLGNHIAGQNIRLGSYWLSGDGQNEGVSVTASGDVGVGTLVPAAKLDVAGGVKLGNDPAACTGTLAGTMRYLNNRLHLCNGTNWMTADMLPPVAACPADLDTSPTSGDRIVCTCPASPTGSAWGSNPYTSDSNLCLIALHAGAMTSAGGTIYAEIVPGISFWPASSRNGVTTTSHASAWSHGVTFPGIAHSVVTSAANDAQFTIGPGPSSNANAVLSFVSKNSGSNAGGTILTDYVGALIFKNENNQVMKWGDYGDFQIMTLETDSTPLLTVNGKVKAEGFYEDIQTVNSNSSITSFAANGAGTILLTQTSGTSGVTTITGCDSGLYAQGQRLTIVVVGRAAGTLTLSDTAVGTATADSMVLSGSLSISNPTAVGSTLTLMCTTIDSTKRWVELARSWNVN
ncbi:MAG TPA: LCCL domain-containing protein, partial [Bdellovibrionales bacterium]|nr:LCCL domain-containing protein [Bdellovibrionales bacterium]